MLIAGGSGARMGQDIPKQFLNVYDRPVIIYTLEAFQNHPNIDAIMVVCVKGWETILSAYAKQFNISRPKVTQYYNIDYLSGIPNQLMRLYLSTL